MSEYAVHGRDAGSGSLLAALAEAAFLIGLEKNRYRRSSHHHRAIETSHSPFFMCLQNDSKLLKACYSVWSFILKKFSLTFGFLSNDLYK